MINVIRKTVRLGDFFSTLRGYFTQKLTTGDFISLVIMGCLMTWAYIHNLDRIAATAQSIRVHEQIISETIIVPKTDGKIRFSIDVSNQNGQCVKVIRQYSLDSEGVFRRETAKVHVDLLPSGGACPLY